MRLVGLTSLSRARGATRVGDHADIRHATLGCRAILALLTNPGGIQTNTRAGATLRVALPLPGFLRAELDSLLLLLEEPLAGRFRRPLDGRFTHPQAASLAQRSFTHLGETVLHAQQADHLFRRRREPLMSQPQHPLPGELALTALATVIITSHQFELAKQTHKPLAAMSDELGIAAAVRAHAASTHVPTPFFAARWRRSPKPSLRAHALGPAPHTHFCRTAPHPSSTPGTSPVATVPPQTTVPAAQTRPARLPTNSAPPPSHTSVVERNPGTYPPFGTPIPLERIFHHIGDAHTLVIGHYLWFSA